MTTLKCYVHQLLLTDLALLRPTTSALLKSGDDRLLERRILEATQKINNSKKKKKSKPRNGRAIKKPACSRLSSAVVGRWWPASGKLPPRRIQSWTPAEVTSVTTRSQLWQTPEAPGGRCSGRGTRVGDTWLLASSGRRTESEAGKLWSSLGSYANASPMVVKARPGQTCGLWQPSLCEGDVAGLVPVWVRGSVSCG